MNLFEYLDRRGERRANLAVQRPVNVRLLANVIGCSLVFGFLGAMFALFIIPIPKANEGVITYMIGQLSGFAGGIVAYHYTSKAGDREREDQRAEVDVHRAELDVQRAQNTARLAEAITASAKASGASRIEKPLADMTLDELIATASLEGVDMPDPITEEAYRAAIEAKRAGAA